LTIALERKSTANYRSLRIDPELFAELEIIKVRRRLRSVEAALHVVLCPVLGREDLLPKDLTSSRS
jgi:hypothetical protein